MTWLTRAESSALAFDSFPAVPASLVVTPEVTFGDSVELRLSSSSLSSEAESESEENGTGLLPEGSPFAVRETEGGSEGGWTPRPLGSRSGTSLPRRAGEDNWSPPPFGGKAGLWWW